MTMVDQPLFDDGTDPLAPDDAEPGTVTVDAPYGVNPKTGKPYKMSPAERAAAGARLRDARAAKAATAPEPTIPAPPRVAAAPAGVKLSPTHKKRAQTVCDVVGIPLGLAVKFRAKVPPVFVDDAMVIAEGLPDLAVALAEVADDVPWLAKILDGGGEMSPYAKLALAGLPIAVGLVRNHFFSAPAQVAMPPAEPEPVVPAPGADPAMYADWVSDAPPAF